MTPKQRKAVLTIAVPTSLEFVVMLAMGFVNQIIVGVRGETAIAAVGFCTSLTFIVMVVIGALGMSVSILMARGFGAGRRSELSHTLSVALLLGLVITTLIALVPSFGAHAVLSVTGASAAVADAGATYLALTSISLVPIVLGMILSGAMRSTGHPRSPMIATFVTVPLTSALAYLLVLGIGPFPELGVAGAGWAILITSALKLAILLVQFYGVHRTASWELPGISHWREIVGPLIVLALPLAITELLWTGGNFLYSVLFARLGDGQLAAANIAAAIEGIFIVGSIGLMAASTALIGKAVGEGDAPEAEAWVSRILRAGVWTGAIFGGSMALTILAIPAIFPNTGSSVQTLAMIGIAFNAVFQIIKVRNMILGGSVLASGSDVRGVIMGDGISAFAIGLPLAILLGLFTPLGFAGIFLARGIEEVGKLAIFRWRSRRIRWSTLVEFEAARSV